MKVIVFDLDDTLYEEMSYVRSGFRAVAEYLQAQLAIEASVSYAFMLEELERSGRGKVFDSLLQQHQCFTQQRRRGCLQAYRSHLPDIELYEDARRCLQRLAGYPLYIVTDGNKLVQYAKLKALGLLDDPRMRKCYISRRFGIHNEKPSPYCFQQICRLERAAPEEVVYIGDNPNKDFVGIKPLGFQTVRIMRGAFASVEKSTEFEAQTRIYSLDEFVVHA